MAIYEELRKIRELKKISRKKVAEYLNCSQELIRDIETGKIALKLETYLKLCEYYKISPYELLNTDKSKHIVILDNESLINLKKFFNKVFCQII